MAATSRLPATALECVEYGDQEVMALWEGNRTTPCERSRPARRGHEPVRE